MTQKVPNKLALKICRKSVKQSRNADDQILFQIFDLILGQLDRHQLSENIRNPEHEKTQTSL